MIPIPQRNDETAALAKQYGEPLHYVAELADINLPPITKTDRTSEVCMVVQRTNGTFLTATKDYYPRGHYRLLTGGISPGEPIVAALVRETNEETGLLVEVRRFLAIVEYRHLQPDVPPRSIPFKTYAFLLDEISGMLMINDPDERISAFHEVTAGEIGHIGDRLAALPAEYHPEIKTTWQTWGQFRSHVHRAVATALQT